MVGERGPYLPGNFISATVGLVYINLQPEYELHFWNCLKRVELGSSELPSSTRFRQFQKFERN